MQCENKSTDNVIIMFNVGYIYCIIPGGYLWKNSNSK